MPGREIGLLQPAQRDEAGEEFAVRHLFRAGLAMRADQRVGALVVAVAQQPAGQNLAFAPVLRQARRGGVGLRARALRQP